ncbi:hypothetical protein [Nocardia alba]|uniref:Uncharacterized protein n=1 Tax=Nocardia alba TaxID=225051 RepID=A0A4R1FYR4_9NOCA|nr:hypothetical protein [Nocardia alba]TCK00348.1 hypothetical protein DFR71_1346 [Nocardia alba]
MGRIRRWAPRAVGIVVTVACLIGATRLLWPQPGLDEQPGSTARQLAFLRDALDEGSDTAAQQLFPEGYVFSNVLYGLAWVQAAHTDPGLRADALRESRWALARVESDEGRAIFSPRLQPAYGVFWAGWTNWLRGAILTLDRSDTAAVQQFSTHSTELAQAFAAADTPFLQAYRGQAWPVDSTVAMASLRLHDKLFGARYTAVTDRWLEQAETRLDPATGLLPHQVSPTDGSMLTGARATSQTVILRFLPEIDPAFATSQYTRYRDQFLAYPGGFGPVVREYPKGVDGSGDVDSGPLVAGISLSATVVAVGAARMNGDRALAAAIGAEGELIGLPVDLPWSKRYAFGLLPIGDAFVVWSSTARPLTEPPTTLGRELRWWWRLPWLSVLILIAIAPWVWTLRRVGLARATDPASSPPSPALVSGEGGGRAAS